MQDDFAIDEQIHSLVLSLSHSFSLFLSLSLSLSLSSSVWLTENECLNANNRRMD